ncbi:hypothetical protein IW147_005331 [Coemansia sp. RSA 720]|nr:hypothetical protein LPJ76_006251 [Coemansia sp. RSA 638]KAJ2120092.1 hypothetical protein IW147_005331 [Coemansia sp. RSA 720]KAJ2538118.1 hypothetical protein GGF49_006098 [Coemansia sp. RSA 1853]
MTTTHPQLVNDLCPLVLLESFLDQAIRYSINTLALRARLGRMQQRQYMESLESGFDDNSEYAWSFTDFEQARTEMAELQLKMRNTFSLVDKLYARTAGGEMMPKLLIRSMLFEFLRTCFSDILPGSESARAAPTRRRHVSADALQNATRDTACSQYEIARKDIEQHRLWALVRPARPPSVVLQQFLMLSAQVGELQRKSLEMATPLRVGVGWYKLLTQLLAHLALSAREFGEYSNEQALQAIDLVSPSTDDRKILYPMLWSRAEQEFISGFDDSWKNVRELVEALDGPESASAIESLYAISSSHGFCELLFRYMETALHHMQPPILDLYYNISQTCQVPPGFFETPDQNATLPEHSQLVGQNSMIGDSEDASLLMLDPFSPQASSSASRLMALSSAGVDNNENGQSPSERVAQAHAYHVMAMSAKRATLKPGSNTVTDSPTENVLSQQSRLGERNHSTPIRSRALLLACDGDDSGMSDVEMSPSQHAAIKRQKSSDFALIGDANTTPPRRKSGVDVSALDDDSMDVENTVVVESPSALLSAKHDRRVRDGVQRTHTPPTLHLTPEIESADTGPDAANRQLSRNNPSAMTTPKSQRVAARYVSTWEQGDVEGGGRQHRRRHDVDDLGTPNTLRVNKMQPPPQTLLSPKNIAAAQRRNTQLNALAAKTTGGSTNGDNGGYPVHTPERTKVAAVNCQSAQVTPEHQVGLTADIRARSASRYVIRKEQGDVEGGGRKHRKRQRGHETVYLDL